jgi:hypothetical protein
LVDDDTKNLFILELVECRDTQISCIAAKSLAEPLEACRPEEILKCVVPKHPEVLGGANRRAPLREAFIPNIKSLASKAGWQGYKSMPTSEGHTFRAPNQVGRAIDIPRYCKT